MHLPVGTKPLFEKRIADIPQENRASWRFHIVKPGESLDEVADDFHVKTHEIAEVNGLGPKDSPDEGDELIIPVAPAATPSGMHSAHYTVRHGDTLITVADRFGVSVESLRAWNHLRSNTVTVGHSLIVAEPLHLAPSVRTRKHGSHTSSSHSTRTTSSRTSTHNTHTSSTSHATVTSRAAHPTANSSSPAHKNSTATSSKTRKKTQ